MTNPPSGEAKVHETVAKMNELLEGAKAIAVPMPFVKVMQDVEAFCGDNKLLWGMMTSATEDVLARLKEFVKDPAVAPLFSVLKDLEDRRRSE